MHFLISMFDEIKMFRRLIDEKCAETSYIFHADFPLGHCYQTSYFLAYYLTKNGYDAKFKVICGETHNSSHPDNVVHWWLECEGFVVDITADQFNRGEYCQEVVSHRPYKPIHYGPYSAQPHSNVFKIVERQSHAFNVDNLGDDVLDNYRVVFDELGLVNLT